jgi:hypothetical protein
MAPRSPPAAHRAGETFKRLHRLRRRCIQHPRLSTLYPGEPAHLHLRACRLPTASGGQHKAQSTKDAAGRQAFLLTSAACLFYSPGGLMIQYETQCAAYIRRTQPQFHSNSVTQSSVDRSASCFRSPGAAAAAGWLKTAISSRVRLPSAAPPPACCSDRRPHRGAPRRPTALLPAPLYLHTSSQHPSGHCCARKTPLSRPISQR